MPQLCDFIFLCFTRTLESLTPWTLGERTGTMCKISRTGKN
ncbi:hypothetical protein D3OALGB2SA_1152 [Olavius algarvensis associated proteobacterium Delta 3]|nr:hypothetical protein D3OALGB2SA_1152 [Olavius algarvensis associated proteobacterium Delta 3]